MADFKEYMRDGQVDHPPALYEDYKSTVLRSPSRKAVRLEHTLSEITGPIYGHGPILEGEDDLSIVEGIGEDKIFEGLELTADDWEEIEEYEYAFV